MGWILQEQTSPSPFCSIVDPNNQTQRSFAKYAVHMFGQAYVVA